MTSKIAVILFPGTNCELEALRACRRANIKADLFRWNDDRKKLKAYDGFILPGGFSYEDRGRSGVVASKDPVLDVIKSEALKGKPVMGICNGAQILVETGLIPGLSSDHLQMALAWNERIKKGKILGVGFYNDWVYMRSDVKKNKTPYNRFSEKVLMQIPIAHGEGRFTTMEKDLLKTLIKNDQTLFRYCDNKGEIKDEFPINPNGAMYNLAGVCNTEGNVLALMPHPERTLNGQPIFDSLAEYFSANKKIVVKKTQYPTDYKVEKVKQLSEKPDLTITVELKITDNEERTIEQAIKSMGYKDIFLKRRISYGFYLSTKANAKTVAEKILASGEIVNLNKEVPLITINEKNYSYDKTNGLQEESVRNSQTVRYLTTDIDNYFGKSTFDKLKPYFPKSEITKVMKGTEWGLTLKKSDSAEKIVATHIFHNPNSMKLFALT